MPAQVRVLFVCMGNICRSPTGEGVFQHYVETSGYNDVILVDSAGIIDYHAGSPADARMRAAASRRGYALNSIARQVVPDDIDAFDLIVAMDLDNLMGLQELAKGPREHIRMLGTYLDGAGTNDLARSVPDPYYGGAQGFEEVLDMIERACPRLLDHCLAILRAKSG